MSVGSGQMGKGLRASHNLFVYVGTEKDNSQWEIQRDMTSKQDRRVGIMGEIKVHSRILSRTKFLSPSLIFLNPLHHGVFLYLY